MVPGRQTGVTDGRPRSDSRGRLTGTDGNKAYVALGRKPAVSDPSSVVGR
jgi:hypothetical protein